ncbi:MAG TPA: neutral zinc metallopeptidase [Pirellulales bacterium]|jgi:hypothetical protein
MRWEGREESQNVDDRRRMGGPAVAMGGGGLLVIIVLALLFGVDPQQLLNAPGVNVGAPGAPAEEGPADPEEERLASFSKVVFNDTELVWSDIFSKMGRRYQSPTLVLFSGRVESACGLASAAVGPFYCGGDSNVYIDLAFYRDMERKLHAPGEFARAYVLAHEVGHYVQRLLGFADMAQQQRGFGRGDKNQASVRLELQADFLAGVWAHHAQEKFDYLDPGDVESALNAANQIGDDRLQKQAQGYVVPDAFTHGTSEQRKRWFSRGFKNGDVREATLLFETEYDQL